MKDPHCLRGSGAYCGKTGNAADQHLIKMIRGEDAQRISLADAFHCYNTSAQAVWNAEEDTLAHLQTDKPQRLLVTCHCFPINLSPESACSADIVSKSQVTWKPWKADGGALVMQAGNDVGYRVMFRQDEDSATEGSSADENEDNAGRPAKCFAFQPLVQWTDMVRKFRAKFKRGINFRHLRTAFEETSKIMKKPLQVSIPMGPSRWEAFIRAHHF